CQFVPAGDRRGNLSIALRADGMGPRREFTGRWSCRCRDICQAIKQPVESQAVLFYSCTFAIGERYQRQPPINIYLGFKHLRLAAWFRNVEIAAGASQSVRALLKERVTAVAMTDIVVLPRF